jgi:hypothetical protein
MARGTRENRCISARAVRREQQRRSLRELTDDEFLSAFQDRTLPAAEWTHRAHVRMAWLYLNRLSLGRALHKVRAGIRRYNAVQGSDGYHDTITAAYVRLIHSRMAGSDGPETFAAFCERNPDLLDRSLDLLLRHYDRATLFSLRAKERFIEPDLEPLPA